MIRQRNRVKDYIALLSQYPPDAIVSLPFGGGEEDNELKMIPLHDGSFLLRGNWRQDDRAQFIVLVPGMVKHEHVSWLVGMGACFDQDVDSEYDACSKKTAYRFRDADLGMAFKFKYG